MVIAELASAVPGRLRLRLPAATPSDLEELTEALRGIASIHTVRHSVVSRSIVVQHAESAEVLEDLRDALGRRSVELRALAATQRPSASDLGRTIRRVAVGELGVVIPVSLGGLALAQLVRGEDRLRDAPWYVLAWYAYSTASRWCGTIERAERR